MKKRWIISITLGVVFALGLGLAACTPKPVDPPDPPVPDYCAVTFDANGGTFPDGTTTKEQIIRYDTPATPIAEKPVLDGRYFGYWALDGVQYNFADPIKKDVTLTAVWASEGLDGEGTEAAPYRLSTAADIAKMAKAVAQDGGDYLSAHYEVTADIDAADVKIAPMGTDAAPFTGVFEGGGFTISNLTVEARRDTEFSEEESGFVYAGLFGYAKGARINGVRLENAVVSADVSVAGEVYAGALIGRSDVGVLTDCFVSGRVAVKTVGGNGVSLGGAAGYAQSAADEENHTKLLSTARGIESAVTFETRSYTTELTDVVIGGIFGMLHGSQGAYTLADCVNTADFKATGAAGGIVGAAAGDLVSIVNCYNKGNINATSTAGPAYAGGIAGQLACNGIIADSLSTGKVIASGANNNDYASMAGGIVGYLKSADTYYGYVQGGIVVNSFYTQDATTNKGGKITAEGDKIAAVTEALVKNTLKWESIAVSPDGVATLALAELPESYTVTLHNGDETTSFDVTAGGIVGRIDAPETDELFFDWSYTADTLQEYRYFMTAYKNIDLYAYTYDVSEIAGAYHTDSDGQGTLVLGADGKLTLLTELADVGSYRYNGELFVAYLDSYFGDICGTFDADGKLIFTVAYGMNDYTFEFAKYEPAVLGEYLDTANGHFLTFSGTETATLNIAGETTKFRYEITTGGKFNFINLTEGKAGKPTAVLKIETDGRISVYSSVKEQLFAASDVFESAEGLVGNYGDLDFLGTWNFFVPGSGSDGVIHGQIKSFAFDEKGCVTYESPFSTQVLRYFYIEENDAIMVIGDFISWYYVDADAEVLYGDMVTGASMTTPIVAVRGEPEMMYGAPPVSVGSNSSRVVTIVVKTTDGKFYVIHNNTYAPDAAVTGTFERGSQVTVTAGGVTETYCVVEGKNPYVSAPNILGDMLVPIGEEEGTYQLGKETVKLDGIGGATRGDVSGRYHLYGTTVTIVFDNDTVLAFDYAAADAADGVIALPETDGFEGVMYYEGTTDEGAKFSYKLVINGLGQWYYYYYNSDYEEYRINFSQDCLYTVTTSISLRGNLGTHDSYYVTVDENNAVLSCMGDDLFTKKGETPVAATNMPASYRGTFVNGDDTLVIVSAREAKWNDAAVEAAYRADGYYFRVGTTEYRCVFGANDILNVNDKAFTRFGTPPPTEGLAVMVGTWKLTSSALYLPDSFTVQPDGKIIIGETELIGTYDTVAKTLKFGYTNESYAYECRYLEAEDGLEVIGYEDGTFAASAEYVREST